MKPPRNPIQFHAFCCGVSCCAFTILIVTTCLLFAYGFIIPALVGWALSILALIALLYHRK